MTCYSPLKCWAPSFPSIHGKQYLFKTPKIPAVPAEVPCRQCIGCRLDKSNEWAARCVHESKLHAQNTFITLTYNDLHLPRNMSLQPRDLQLFWKKLRKKFGSGIRYYACGEYGDQFGRPHYHACIFGLDFPDLIQIATSNGLPVYRSAILEELWPLGYSSVGSFTYESAAYVARYTIKKVNGKRAAEHYAYIDYSTGEIHQRKPEFSRQSNRGGIGLGFFEKFHSDMYPHDYVVLNGKKQPIPRYYDKKFELLSPDEHAFLKKNRVYKAKFSLDNNTHERLQVREAVRLAAVSQLKRVLD